MILKFRRFNWNVSMFGIGTKYGKYIVSISKDVVSGGYNLTVNDHEADVNCINELLNSEDQAKQRAEEWIVNDIKQTYFE